MSSPRIPAEFEAKTKTAERRAWVRLPSRATAYCQPSGTGNDLGGWWVGGVRDISPGGVGLVLKERFEPGTMLSIELQSTRAHCCHLLLARVVNARHQAGLGWVVGCEFAVPLSEEELRDLT